MSLGQYQCPHCYKSIHRSKIQDHINSCPQNSARY